MMQESIAALRAHFGDTIVETTEDRGTHTAVVAAQDLPAVVEYLRDDAAQGYSMLLDITAVDYLDFPQTQPARFAVVYLLRNWEQNRVLCLKVWVEDPEQQQVPTITHLFRNANWAERETWDQYGIRFEGHPCLKRILNHHQFEGHPLRKDYPLTGRHICIEPDTLMDEMRLRLAEKGIDI